MTSTSIFYIIVSKYSHKKESGPIVLFIIDKNLEIGLYCTILSLSLAISLRVKNSEKPLLDPKEVV